MILRKHFSKVTIIKQLVSLKFLKITSIFILIVACEGEVGENGKEGLNSIVVSIEEPIGTNCNTGGLKISTGVDINENAILDADEITMTEFACNGIDGATTLSSFVNEPAGSNCLSGGLRINYGIDLNKNGVLDINEEETSVYLCTGLNANTTLTRTTNISKGLNCEMGGLKIESGLDLNKNAVLDLEEISDTSFVCNGEESNKNLVQINYFDVNEQCLQGGLIIESGQDTNANNNLDDDEIRIRRRICNGIDGQINKEIRIPFFLIGKGVSVGYRTGYATSLLKFNIENWENAVGVYLSTTIGTSNSNSLATAAVSFNTFGSIENSDVSTRNTEFKTILSDNFIAYFPKGETTLYLYVNTEIFGETVRLTGKTELIILQDIR